MNINPESARDILCKNILIYGYCKFENKGCVFSHTRTGDTKAEDPKASERRKFNMNTPLFQPNVTGLANKFSTLSPKLKDVPVFVPEKNDTPKKFNAMTPSFTPAFDPQPPASAPSQPLRQQQPQPQPPPTAPPQSNPYLSNGGVPASQGDYMFQQQSQYPLNYHLYAPAPPPRHQIPLPPHETSANRMFIENELREALHRKNEATLQTMPRLNLPDHVGMYHLLVPIDNSFETLSKVWKIPTSVFKVFSNIDGNAYALRKIDNSLVIRIVSESPFKTIKKWRTVKNANVVQLQDAFTSMAFGDDAACLMMVYDYFPTANTLLEHHVVRKLGGKLEPVTEDLLWTYVIQLTNALSAIHDKHLAARSSLDLSKIIVTNKNRIRLLAVGTDDVLLHEQDEAAIAESSLADHVKHLQLEDIRKLGRVLLDLALVSRPNAKSLPLTDILKQLPYTAEFVRVVEVLNSVDRDFDLAEFSKRHLTPRLLASVNALQDAADVAESELTRELENGRLFRLITKINFIIDRPDFHAELAENGPKYVVRLFRDYVFYQVDDAGRPVVDLSRVLVNLNKLDAGIDEKILLVSRDEKSCVIVSYKEIRDVIDQLFRSLN